MRLQVGDLAFLGRPTDPLGNPGPEVRRRRSVVERLCPLDYLTQLGLDSVAAYEHELLAYATDALSRLPGLRLIGIADRKASLLSFVLDRVHPHDIGTILDREGVAVRTGHHCAQPVMERFGVSATTRASLALYNTRADVDALVAALHQVREVFA